MAAARTAASALGVVPGRQVGLLRHYWVVQKLVINLVAIVVLLLYQASGHDPVRATQAA